MTSKPNLEIGYGMAQGGEALEVGAETARRALQQSREHPLSVVLVFASVCYNPEKLLQGIRRLTGEAPLLGTATAGEICNDRQEESVVVVALASPHLRVKVGVGQGVSQDWQRALLEAVTAPEVAAFFGSPDDTIWSVSAQEGKSAFAFLFTPGTLTPGRSYGFDILSTLQRLTQGRLPIMGAGTPGTGPAAANVVGEGTVFKIYLRQLQETMEESPGKAAVASPVQGSETVLVVEDEKILLELIKEALEMHGYLVMAAHNGEEAIELCQQHREPIDLMLTDVVMPQQNGRELAEFLAPLHPEMKTLYMSGYTEDAMVVRSLVEAALPFIQKPFPPLDLVRKVREMIDSRGN